VRKRVYKRQSEEHGEEKPGVQDEKRAGHADIEERNAYLEAMINSTSDAIIALDQNFHIRDLNPAAVAALGCSMNEAYGHKCTEVLRCQNLNHMELCGTSSCPLVRVMQDTKPLANVELILGIGPEHECEISTSVTPVLTAEDCYVVFTTRDMSALKVANRVRANFISMVSHELRTPLNSVHGFIDLILQGHMGALSEEQQVYLGYTQEGVQQLISIVEDILFMTRSDLGQFEIKQQKVQIPSLVRQVVDGMRPQAFKASVELRQDVAADVPLLYVDPQRIKQVLNNLVSNAIKFTPPGGTIIVSEHQYNERFEMISVADTGYGIPAEDRQHIFERFYQSNHSEQSKMGGYGLGLSIARLIVDQHGGTIDFDTTLNKGTTFYFTVPLYTGQNA
jgi:two-component system phosphate regulon sensor histidine kinase PhoR